MVQKNSGKFRIPEKKPDSKIFRIFSKMNFWRYFMIIKCFSFFNLAIFKAAMAFKKSAWKCLRARLEISKVAFDDAKVIARLRELEANVAFIDIYLSAVVSSTRTPIFSDAQWANDPFFHVGYAPKINFGSTHNIEISKS